MKKIKITEGQYKRLILSEQNRLINPKNDLLAESINENAELLEEGWKEIVLGLSMLMGLELSGQNNVMAQKAVHDKDIMNQIEAKLEDKKEIQKIIDMMTQKGMKDPSEMLRKNADEIEDNYNELSDKEKMGVKLSVVAVNNLKSLESKLKQGYAVKSTDITQDTIKGQQKKLVTIKDTVNFKFDNMDNFFETGKYSLSEDGKAAILDAINSIKAQNGKILGAKITSSTDAETMTDFKSETDPTGNIRLANERAESVSSLISGLIDSGDIQIVAIPDNGRDEFSAKMFKDAKMAGKSNVIREKSGKYRYVNIEFIVEFTSETEDPEPKPDQVITKVRIELVKMYVSTGKTVKIGGNTPKFKHKKFKCKRDKKDKSIVAKCFTF